MDMAFFHRAERMLAHSQPVRIDHAIFVAALAVQRDAAFAAGPEPSRFDPPPQAAVDDPLVELVLAGPRWRHALFAQRGCFSRAEAGRSINVL